MKSGWFWSTPQWESYQLEYWKGRERPDEYKTSPLAQDHDFSDSNGSYDFFHHQTQVIDLTPPIDELWRGVRKSYHSIIHRAEEACEISEWASLSFYQELHHRANGRQPRPSATYEYQAAWLKDGHGMIVNARPHNWETFVASSYWILYKTCAYYMSGPSISRNVQHAVIWHSLSLLKARGIRLVEMGQIDGDTDKERNIGKFKQGFGGQMMPFTIARRR